MFEEEVVPHLVRQILAEAIRNYQSMNLQLSTITAFIEKDGKVLPLLILVVQISAHTGIERH